MLYNWLNLVPRGIGHTTAACGKNVQPCVVVVSSMHEAQLINNMPDVGAVSLPDLRKRLHGWSTPLVFDFQTVLNIVNQYEGRLTAIQCALDGVRYE